MKKLHKLSKLLLIPLAGLFALTFNIPTHARTYQHYTVYTSIIISGGITSLDVDCRPETESGVCFFDTSGSHYWLSSSAPILNSVYGMDTSISIVYDNAPGYQNAQCTADGIIKASGESFALSTDSFNPTKIVCTAEPVPESTISMTIPTDANLPIVPTAEGTLESKSFDIIVSTDSRIGYTLSMYNESSDLVNATTSATIPTLQDDTTKSNFPVNRWGYSLDDTTYKPIPADTKTVLKTTKAPDDEDITTFNLAAKIDATKPAGSYSNNFVFMAVINVPTIETLNIVGLGDVQYEAGMTWHEWLESDYNTSGLGKKKFNNYGEDSYENIYSASSSDIFPPNDNNYYKESAFREYMAGEYFVSGASESDDPDYSGFGLYRLISQSDYGKSAFYGEVLIDEPIEFMTDYYDKDGNYSTMPTVYVYANWQRETTASLATEDYSAYTEAYVYRTTTWAEWVEETPETWIMNWETGDGNNYDVSLVDNVITFTNQDDPDIVYALVDVSPSDIIVGQDYRLVQQEVSSKIYVAGSCNNQALASGTKLNGIYVRPDMENPCTMNEGEGMLDLIRANATIVLEGTNQLTFQTDNDSGGDSPWKYYENAFIVVLGFCDNSGNECQSENNVLGPSSTWTVELNPGVKAVWVMVANWQ